MITLQTSHTYIVLDRDEHWWFRVQIDWNEHEVALTLSMFTWQGVFAFLCPTKHFKGDRGSAGFGKERIAYI